MCEEVSKNWNDHKTPNLSLIGARATSEATDQSTGSSRLSVTSGVDSQILTEVLLCVSLCATLDHSVLYVGHFVHIQMGFVLHWPKELQIVNMQMTVWCCECNSGPVQSFRETQWLPVEVLTELQ